MSARTRGWPVWTRRAAWVFMRPVSVQGNDSRLFQREGDLVGDVVTGQSQHLAGIFLLAGFLEKGVGGAEAQKLFMLRLGIGEPFGNRRTKTADQRMLFDGGD